MPAAGVAGFIFALESNLSFITLFMLLLQFPTMDWQILDFI